MEKPGASSGRDGHFRVFVPHGLALASVQPFVLQGASGGWAWTGAYTPASQLQAGAWNTLTVTVPANAAAIARLGVEIRATSAVSGSVYIDAINW